MSFSTLSNNIKAHLAAAAVIAFIALLFAGGPKAFLAFLLAVMVAIAYSVLYAMSRTFFDSE
jgi:hypothetical protein